MRSRFLSSLCVCVLLGCSGSDESSPAVGAGGTGQPADASLAQETATNEASIDVLMVDVARADPCGNGLDDDENGKIDDECECAEGDTQPCFVGAAQQAGVGTCSWGTQTCVKTASGEVSSWGWDTCQGAGQPHPEGCDGVDNDCDGEIDEGEPACDAPKVCINHGCCYPAGAAPNGGGNSPSYPSNYTNCATQPEECEGLSVGKIITPEDTSVHSFVRSDAQECCSHRLKVIATDPGYCPYGVWELRCVD